MSSYLTLEPRPILKALAHYAANTRASEVARLERVAKLAARYCAKGAD